MALYVRRDPDGRVVAAFAEPQADAAELLPPQHPDLRAFLAGQDDGTAEADLALSDIEMARVVEDVIEVLIGRNLLQITDFPPAVRDKLLRRRQARGRLRNSVNLTGPDDELI
jgi:hypothetical protein